MVMTSFETSQTMAYGNFKTVEHVDLTMSCVRILFLCLDVPPSLQAMTNPYKIDKIEGVPLL